MLHPFPLSLLLTDHDLFHLTFVSSTVSTVGVSKDVVTHMDGLAVLILEVV